MSNRWVSWAAVSSLPQAKKVSIENQLEENRRHIDKWGGVLVSELVVPGESRSIVMYDDAANRIAAYADLRRLVQSRAFDVLVYLDRSRLGRRASLSMTVVEMCRDAGIVCYETESPPVTLDSAQSYDDMLLGAIKSVGAQREVHKIVERRAAGMIGRVQRGEFANKPPYGYRYVYNEDGTRRAEIDQEAAAAIRYAFLDLYIDRGLTILDVSKEAEKRTPGTPWVLGRGFASRLNSILGRLDRYAGYSEFNVESKRGGQYVRAKGSWPAIITEQELAMIKAERASRARSKRAVAQRHLFSRAITCQRCGARLHWQAAMPTKGTGAEGYYRCVSEGCRKSVRQEAARDALLAAIDYVATGENRAVVVGDADSQRANLTQRLSDIDRQLERTTASRERLIDAYVTHGTMDANEYADRMRTVQQRITELTMQRGDTSDALLAADSADRYVRLEQLAIEGRAILAGNVVTANAWVRNHFRLWALDNAIVEVEYL